LYLKMRTLRVHFKIQNQLLSDWPFLSKG
jgi:hypothetical protein